MAQADAGIASLEARARIANFGIWAVVVVCVPLACLYGLQCIAYIGSGSPSINLYGLTLVVSTLLYLLILLSAIAVLIWIHRAHANLHDAGLADLNYSAGWAVACWFVPLVNLMVPFTSMRELHNRSHAEEAWNAAAGVDAVTTWWTFQIASSFILTFTTLTFLVNYGLPDIWLTTPPAADAGLNIAGFGMLAGSALYLRKIINAITSAQRGGTGYASVFE